jgi:hypothetical protein
VDSRLHPNTARGHISRMIGRKPQKSRARFARPRARWVHSCRQPATEYPRCRASMSGAARRREGGASRRAPLHREDAHRAHLATASSAATRTGGTNVRGETTLHRKHSHVPNPTKHVRRADEARTALNAHARERPSVRCSSRQRRQLALDVVPPISTCEGVRRLWQCILVVSRLLSRSLTIPHRIRIRKKRVEKKRARAR